MSDKIVDRDEYGRPVSELYSRLGASGENEGLYIRFSPGMGLNVYIGLRRNFSPLPNVPMYKDDSQEFGMSGQGWDNLCKLVDEWRAREAKR